MKILGDNNTTERKLPVYTQIYKWSFSIWHVKLKKYRLESE